MKQCFLFLMTLASVMIFSGCASTTNFLVNIDSINSGAVDKQKTYALFPGNKDTLPDDLQYKEYAFYVKRALSTIGLTPKEGDSPADIAIFLGYGISDPQMRQFTYSVPTWGVTGYSSSTTTGSVTSYGNYGTFSGTTHNTPQYGVTGATSHLGNYTSFFRWITLDAYDVASYLNGNKMVPVWKTNITSTGRSGDLRQVFPVLLAASAQHIGTNTGKKLEISISEEDPTVSYVKGIALQEKEQEK